MAAGQGFKTFTTGEVLTAGDVNGYLMQGVLVFASTAARDAAITSPAEGQFAFTKDTNSLFYYDGAAWVASGATGDIEGVTAGIGISGGGTSGTVTVTNSMATAIDAKGDLVAGTGADTFAKLTVGANNTVLTADSAEATGLKWATPASGGGMTLISETVASSLSSLAFSSLGSYKQLLLVWSGITFSGNGNVGLRFNSNSGSIYTGGVVGAVNTTASNLYNTHTSVGNQYELLGQSVTSGAQNASRGYLIIDNYTSSTKYKVYYGQYQNKDNQYNELKSHNIIGTFEDTTAITSLNFFSSSPTFSNATNTTIRLYGVA